MLLEKETKDKFGYSQASLTRYSKSYVIVCCDYCSHIFEKTNHKYIDGRKNSNFDCCSNIECMKKKREESMLKKHGVKTAGELGVGKTQSQETKQKRGISIKKTNQERYGVDNVFQLQSTKDKSRETSLMKYGTEHPFQNEGVRDKSKATFQSRYGVDHALQNKDFLNKATKTTIDRYGVSSFSKTEQFRIACEKRRKKFNGMDYNKIAEETGKAYSTVVGQIQQYGFDYAMHNELKMTGIEHKVSEWLKSESIQYEFNKTFSPGYRSDFIIGNIAIEVNGNYWHSDLFLKDRQYHHKKRLEYINKGYTPLFFAEDEINNKFDVVKSIIKNRLKLSNKIMARKCEIVTMSLNESNVFFSNNHLMGKGSGQSYGLKYDGNIVCATRIIQKTTHLEVSRFSTLINTTVTGGFSKLLKFIIEKHNPKFIVNFVDLRYGTGNHLLNLGFTRAKTYLSFNWTNFKDREHRMLYPGNSGYDNGLYKIWDCGQAKYTLEVL